MHQPQRQLTGSRIEYYPEYRWFALLLPLAYVISPKLQLGSLSFRAGELWLAGAMFLILLPVAYERVLNVRLLDKVFAFIVVSMAISFAGAMVMDPGSVGLRDLFEFPKVFLYWAVFRIAVTMVWEPKHLRRLMMTGVIAAGTAAIVAMLQSMERFSVNEWLTPLYTSDWHIYKMRTLGRVVGLFENPNYFGLFLSIVIIGIFLVLAKLVVRWNEIELTRWQKVLGGLWLMVVMTAFMLAASRTALLALVLAFPVVATMYVIKHPAGDARAQARRGALLALVLLIVLGVAGNYIGRSLPKAGRVRSMDMMARMEIGIQQLAGELPSTKSSLDERIMRWSVAADRWAERPIAGWGPAKYSAGMDERAPTDNEYLVYAERYGFIGLFAYILLFYAFAREAFRTARRVPREMGLFTPHDFALLNLGLAVVLAFFNLMAGTFYNLHLFPVVLFLHGFMVSLSWED